MINLTCLARTCEEKKFTTFCYQVFGAHYSNWWVRTFAQEQWMMNSRDGRAQLTVASPGGGLLIANVGNLGNSKPWSLGERSETNQNTANPTCRSVAIVVLFLVLIVSRNVVRIFVNEAMKQERFQITTKYSTNNEVFTDFPWLSQSRSSLSPRKPLLTTITVMRGTGIAPWYQW